MGLSDWLNRLVPESRDLSTLVTPDFLARVVPASATYVSVGPVSVIDDAEGFNGGPPGRGQFGTDLGMVRVEGSVVTRTAVLILDRDQLIAISDDGELVRRSAAALTQLDNHRRSGFLLFCVDGSGLAVGTQTPVPIPPGASWRTVPGSTNEFGGWDEVLARYGVEKAKRRRPW